MALCFQPPARETLGATVATMASIIHLGDFTVNQMEEYLRDRGLPMNL